jgi:hypothetical protein
MIRDAAVYMLNKLVMEPTGWEPFTAGYDLDDEAWIADVPVGPGVYLLYTPGHLFTLPGGGTSVLYIGKGTRIDGLRRRLREHRKFTHEVREGLYRGYARYEWMAAYPASAAYAAAPTPASDSAVMESQLLRTFADAFRVAPLGNAQTAWPEEAAEGTEPQKALDNLGPDST